MGLGFSTPRGWKAVNKVNLTGFRGEERRGPYSWTVNSWYDFSRLEDDDFLEIEIINRRGKVALDKTLAIAKEDAESVSFKSKYDGIFQLYYTCRLCNANLTDNFYTDARRIICTAMSIYTRERGRWICGFVY